MMLSGKSRQSLYYNSWPRCVFHRIWLSVLFWTQFVSWEGERERAYLTMWWLGKLKGSLFALGVPTVKSDRVQLRRPSKLTSGSPFGHPKKPTVWGFRLLSDGLLCTGWNPMGKLTVGMPTKLQAASSVVVFATNASIPAAFIELNSCVASIPLARWAYICRAHVKSLLGSCMRWKESKTSSRLIIFWILLYGHFLTSITQDTFEQEALGVQDDEHHWRPQQFQSVCIHSQSMVAWYCHCQCFE